MPKLPHRSGVEIQCALERLGFQKVRQSGSHVVMKRESARRRELLAAGADVGETMD